MQFLKLLLQTFSFSKSLKTLMQGNLINFSFKYIYLRQGIEIHYFTDSNNMLQFDKVLKIGTVSMYAIKKLLRSVD